MLAEMIGTPARGQVFYEPLQEIGLYFVYAVGFHGVPTDDDCSIWSLRLDWVGSRPERPTNEI